MTTNGWTPGWSDVSTRHESIFMFAPISRVDDWLKCGWLPHDALAGTHHGEHAVLVEWICECEIVAPKRGLEPRSAG